MDWLHRVFTGQTVGDWRGAMWVATVVLLIAVGAVLLVAVGGAIGAAIRARAMSAATMVLIWTAAIGAILAAWRCVVWVAARMSGATEAATMPATLDPMEAATWPATLAATWDAMRPATIASNVLFIDGVALPDDIHVSPAPQWASETQKRLLGAWAGTWDDSSSRHILIVEDICADGKARVVWANSDDSEWTREEGTVSGDTLTVEGGLITYKLTATDKLLAKFCFFDIAQARMSRIELAALTRPGATINWPDGAEFLDTDLTEDGKRVRLEVVLFKPNGSGPFPLLVFNHGRIYKWTSGWLPRTQTHLEPAEFFLEKGWVVAFPQRRGSGKSDGHYGEASEVSRWDPWGYTGDPGRNLAAADRALKDIEAAIAALQRRPDVAGKRVLIGGASGGGILSIAYAGLHPEQIAGVINFVGGWIGDRYWRASEINGGLFARGARYDRATLWLYGRGDSRWSIAHSRRNYERFARAGGKGEFIELDVPGGEDGHSLSCYPDLWREHVEKYLETLEPADRP